MKSSNGKFVYVDRKKFIAALEKRGTNPREASKKLGRSPSYLISTFGRKNYTTGDDWFYETKEVGAFNAVTVNGLINTFDMQPEEYEYEPAVVKEHEEPKEPHPLTPCDPVAFSDMQMEQLYSVIVKALNDVFNS